MRYSPNETIEIACEVRRETTLAWLIFDGAKEVWIAKSQVSDYVERPGLIDKMITSIFVPVWLATEKGLV